MASFSSLLFVPEGSLLNERLALRTALRQTMSHFGKQSGPAERIKYNGLANGFKLQSLKKQITLICQSFLPAQGEAGKKYLRWQLSKQEQVMPGSKDFLSTVQGKIPLLLYGKENKVALWPRLKKAGLLAPFSHLFFADDFKQELPDKAVFRIIVQKTKVDPHGVLVIGTNLADEIQGAENANLKSLWLAPKKEKIPITPHPTLHLAKLSDLLFYLNIE